MYKWHKPFVLFIYQAQWRGNTMTTIYNLACTVKFFCGTKENSYGFFSVPGLPDLHVTGKKLVNFGFSPEDMQSRLKASVDVKLKEGKMTLVTIHSIGDVMAAASAAELVEPVPAPKQALPESRAVKVGDIIVATLDNGFDEKHPDYGFFHPLDGSGNIFVHINNMDKDVLRQVNNNPHLWVDVMVKEVGEKRFSGRVQDINRVVKAPKPKGETWTAPQKKLVKEEALRQKEARRQKILARAKVSVQLADGSRNFYGIPVTADEWQGLPDQTLVVLVASYNEVTGYVEGLREVFKVSKKGGQAEKDTPRFPLGWTPKKVQAALNPTGTGLFQVGNETVTAPIYEPVSKCDWEVLEEMMKSGRTANRVAVIATGKYYVGDVTPTGKLHQLPAKLLEVVKFAHAD